MVIDHDDNDDVNDDGSGAAPPTEDVVGTAYRESMQSVDGFTRGANGRIKFNKDTKKRRRENAEDDEDVEMVDTTHHGKKAKRKPQEKLGKEFKAKVCSISVCCKFSLS
jgi:ribosomal RNA-processing protein 12